MGKEELIVYLQSVIDRVYDGSQASFAERNGLSKAYVNDVLRGRRDPGQKILDVFGLERVVSYRVKQESGL